ncbi:hypothetical protein SAMN05444365_104376 [Micromonospora pattaloongensis]|uniref:Uncharacterized protein n=1 Tax=Micromonospora pattaloongensis TaxID=405436 RepID=A0A1H3P881_9ACTN|nr:hypothetical protein [Micromonospora pattaloongensis]SDY97298.1 hypothetical protein SAMN05444365_104376 [Micromonospora pattaloongensis]
MTHPEPSRDDADEPRPNWLDKRRQKIADEIARNRRGEYTVPTWVLALALVVMVGAWVALIVLS